MRKLLLVVMLAALAVPATAPAKGSGSGHKNSAKQAVKECRALRAEMGAEAFRSAFAGKKGKHALGRCVSTKRKARRAARKSARKACRADGLRGQAMKRCVRSTLAEHKAAKPADFENAVEECREDQAEDAEKFAADYGDGSNAFGKCVADEASGEDEGDDDGDEPEDEDGAESGPGETEDETDSDDPDAL